MTSLPGHIDGRWLVGDMHRRLAREKYYLLVNYLLPSSHLTALISYMHGGKEADLISLINTECIES